MRKDQKAVKGYSTVFKKVLERFRDFGKLEHIDHDFKSKLFESFLKESISKKNWGQFFTPIKVVRAIHKMAKMEPKALEGKVICDPACGVGKFPLEFIRENITTLFPIKDGAIHPKVKIVGFDKGFEASEKKTIVLAKANMLIYFCELLKENVDLTKAFAQLFNQSFSLQANTVLGTLAEPTQEAYDLILTNPPYVTSGSSNLKEAISKDTALKNHYKVNAVGVEGLFMEWIIKALKKEGKAFVVAPDGILNRQNDKRLRQYIIETCHIDAIISLPTKTFFTTPKKTYILALTKKRDTSTVQTAPVFTYLCSEIGESRDIYRFDILEDDLSKAAELFNSFKGNKRGFEKLNQDKRCKIQPIERFSSSVDDSWIIDRDWSEQERIALGLKEKDRSISIQEFSLLLKQTADQINTYASLIESVNS